MADDGATVSVTAELVSGAVVFAGVRLGRTLV